MVGEGGVFVEFGEELFFGDCAFGEIGDGGDDTGGALFEIYAHGDGGILIVWEVAVEVSEVGGEAECLGFFDFVFELVFGGEVEDEGSAGDEEDDDDSGDGDSLDYGSAPVASHGVILRGMELNW